MILILVCILGPQGSGKTILMVYLATQSKREVYSNFKIHIPNYKSLEIMDLLELKDNIDVLIDEGYTWLESRTSSSHLNRYLSYIVLQARKRTIDIIISAQLFSTLDVRFRQQADLIIKCKKSEKGFKYSFLFVENNKVRTFVLKWKNAKKLYDMYDTYEIVEPYMKEELKAKLTIRTEKDKWVEILEISEVIKKDIKKLTHPRVLNALMKNGFKANLEEQVYAYLQDLEIEN